MGGYMVSKSVWRHLPFCIYCYGRAFVCLFWRGQHASDPWLSQYRLWEKIVNENCTTNVKRLKQMIAWGSCKAASAEANLLTYILAYSSICLITNLSPTHFQSHLSVRVPADSSNKQPSYLFAYFRKRLMHLPMKHFSEFLIYYLLTNPLII